MFMLKTIFNLSLEFTLVQSRRDFCQSLVCRMTRLIINKRNLFVLASFMIVFRYIRSFFLRAPTVHASNYTSQCCHCAFLRMILMNAIGSKMKFIKYRVTIRMVNNNNKTYEERWQTATTIHIKIIYTKDIKVPGWFESLETSFAALIP